MKLYLGLRLGLGQAWANYGRLHHKILMLMSSSVFSAFLCQHYSAIYRPGIDTAAILVVLCEHKHIS